MLSFLCFMVALQLGVAQMQVEKIEDNSGFTIINEEQIMIPNSFNYSLHIIDLEKFSEILDELKKSAIFLSVSKDSSITKSIEQIEDKLKTLSSSHHSIKKRGLFNVVGTINKWISGTMDDEDRKNINKHLEVNEKNNHGLIQNMNKQIEINDNFNSSIHKLLHNIQDDRKYVKNIIETRNDRVVLQINIFELRLKIQELDTILTELQDNIILTKLNAIHPSLLTHSEILKYNIDANKLKGVKVGFTKTSTNKLIFLIKIPYKMTTVNKQIILPLRDTMSCEMIDTKPTHLIQFNDKHFEYDEKTSISELRNLKHCTMEKNCKHITDFNPEIYHVDEGIILVQLANNLRLSSNRDRREYTLYGNYFIKYFNCTIHIGNNTYSNDIQETQNKYVIPNTDYTENNNTLSFHEILLENKNNLKAIKELKFYKNISYPGISFIIVLILIIIVFISYIYCKQQRITIINKTEPTKTKAIMRTPKQQQNVTTRTHTNTDNPRFFSKGGGVV